MGKVLYIKANPKSDEESRTFRISEEFVKEYRARHPGDEIVLLDLYRENVTFLSEESVKMHKPAPEELRNHPVLRYAYQFLEADKYIFAEPLWNLGIPAILKAYLDYIVVAGITFKYTAEGAKGLCVNKKAVNITTRGGEYSQGAMAEYEMGDRYLRTILGFIGVTDYTTIKAEGLDVIGTDVEQAVEKAIQTARGLATSF